MKREYKFSDISSGLLRIMMIPALLLGAAAARAGTLTHEVQIDLSEIRGTVIEAEGESFTKFEPVKYSVTHEVGLPMLPVVYLNLSVPTYAANFRVSTESQPMAVQKIADRIYPAQREYPVSYEGEKPFDAPDQEFYSRDEWTPSVEYIGTGFLEGDQQIITVAVYPLRYNPSTSDIAIFSSMSVKVDYDIVPASEMALKPLGDNVSVHLTDIAAIVDNPTVYEESVRQKASSQTDEESKIHKYYIITPRNLVASFKRLADWKRQKGYKVIVEAIEDILADPAVADGDPLSSLNDDASKLRAHLRNEFEKDNSPFFLLLGGDDSNMPVFKIHTLTYYEYHKEEKKTDTIDIVTPTDLYFADFQSKWVYNEQIGSYEMYKCVMDFHPEIYIGRLLCTEEIHVKNYTDKLIKYEINPGNGDYEYLGKAFVCIENRMGYQERKSLQYLQDKFPNFSVTSIVGDYDKYVEQDINYDGPSGGDIIQEMNNRYGIFNLQGHGSPRSIEVSCAYFGGKPGEPYYITALDEIPSWGDNNYGRGKPNGIDNLTNFDYPAISYALACTVAPFDIITLSDNSSLKPWEKVRICDAFTIYGQYGGPAFLGNAREGFLGGVSAEIQNFFFDHLINNPNIGIAEALSKQKVVDNDYLKHCRLTHSLIGEPEFSVWTGVSRKFSNILLESSPYKISASGDELKNSLIVLSDGDSPAYRYDMKENTRLTNMSVYKNPVMTVLKRNWIPYIKWSPKNETVTDCEKSFILTNLSLGNASPESEDDYYIVGENARISLDVLDVAKIERGLEVAESGKVNIISHKETIVGAAKVASGGTLGIRSENGVSISEGFTVEKGGILTIETDN